MDIQRAVGAKTGIPAQVLAALDAYADSPCFTAREQAALEFSERVTRQDREVTDACLARLREHFSPGEIVELTFVIGYQIFASRFAKAFRLPSQEFSARPV